MEDLSSLVAMLVVLSVASERLVEIVKGLIPQLDVERDDQQKEGLRRAALHTLSVIAGIVTALLAMETLSTYVPKNWNTTLGVLALGLLASGGSGLWNSILDYANEAKKIKKMDKQEKKDEVESKKGGTRSGQA